MLRTRSSYIVRGLDMICLFATSLQDAEIYGMAYWHVFPEQDSASRS